MNITRGIVVLILPLLLLACNASGDTTPASSNAFPTPVASIEMQQVETLYSNSLEAVIRLSPNRGGAGKQVLIVGDNFPADADVEIHLGGLNTGATEHVYATFRSDGSGAVRGTFLMPEYWPTGEQILVPQVVVLATTPDFLYKATAEFSYESEAGSPIPEDNSPE